MMPRSDGRAAGDLRPVKITPGFIASAHGSALIEVGRTRVVCTAIIATGVKPWLRGGGKGWVTAEYGMLPGSSRERIERPGPGRVNGRGLEISRLIGRALRAGVDLTALGENTITVDCDVLEADGGTRTASITGGWIALARAVAAGQKEKRLPAGEILTDQIVATSCGLVGGRPMVDLNYGEDSQAEVDMNVAMTATGRLVEVQTSAEGATFTPKDLARLVTLAATGCRRLAELQVRAVQSRGGKK
jgi:ribonuclease PH